MVDTGIALRPPARGGHVLAYDVSRKRCLTVAGASNRAATFGDVPARSVWEENRHHWVTIGPEIPGHIQGRTSKASR